MYIHPDILFYLRADVIGYITKYTSVSSFIPKGQERGSILRELFIKDLRYIFISKTTTLNNSILKYVHS
jgi:hypothetical protein